MPRNLQSMPTLHVVLAASTAFLVACGGRIAADFDGADEDLADTDEPRACYDEPSLAAACARPDCVRQSDGLVACHRMLAAQCRPAGTQCRPFDVASCTDAPDSASGFCWPADKP